MRHQPSSRDLSSIWNSLSSANDAWSPVTRASSRTIRASCLYSRLGSFSHMVSGTPGSVFTKSMPRSHISCSPASRTRERSIPAGNHVPQGATLRQVVAGLLPVLESEEVDSRPDRTYPSHLLDSL